MKKLIFIISILFMLASCGKKQAESTKTDESTSVKKIETSVKKGKKYPIEKGIVYQKATVMGIETNPVIYFDKWGDWESTESTVTMEMFGQKTSTSSIKIVKGEDNWDIDMDKKTGYHFSRAAVINQLGVDLEAVSKETMTNMKIEKIGEEKYLGYPCIKYRMKNDKYKMDVEYLSCGNLVMKMKGKVMEIPTEIVVTKIEAVTPPAEKFEIPAGVKIEDQ